VITEHGGCGEIVDEILWHVVDHRDLLEHDLALAVDVGKRRRYHHVAHRIERAAHVGVRHARVDDRRVPRRCRVELAAHRIEQLGELERVVARRPLEEQVLDEVRDPCPIRSLVARADSDPVAERDRSHPGKPLGHDANATRQRRDLRGGHGVILEC